MNCSLSLCDWTQSLIKIDNNAIAPTSIIIDNTAPAITISSPTVYEGDGSSAYSTSDTAHYNNTHANSSHKIVYTVTITDTNLLDNLTFGEALAFELLPIVKLSSKFVSVIVTV